MSFKNIFIVSFSDKFGPSPLDCTVKSEVDVGSQLIIATATATAVYCEAMPPPRVLEIARTIAVQVETLPLPSLM